MAGVSWGPAFGADVLLSAIFALPPNAGSSTEAPPVMLRLRPSESNVFNVYVKSPLIDGLVSVKSAERRVAYSPVPVREADGS